MERERRERLPLERKGGEKGFVARGNFQNLSSNGPFTQTLFSYYF